MFRVREVTITVPFRLVRASVVAGAVLVLALFLAGCGGQGRSSSGEDAGSGDFAAGYPLPSDVDTALTRQFKSEGGVVSYHHCEYFAPNAGPPPVYGCTFKIDGEWHDNIQATGHPDGTFSWEDDS
jgi:hypothetical protein